MTDRSPSPAAESGDAAQSPRMTCDLVVLGAGVAGLTTALVAALEGQRVMVLEKCGAVGGTSAMSSGTIWIPDNPYMRAGGMTDDAAAAMAYLDALVGDRAPRAMRERFVAAGREMVEYLDRYAGMSYRPYPAQPDYRQELPGAGQGWRPLEPMPFDGRTLGAQFEALAWPIPELMVFGRMMVTRGEVARLLTIPTSWDGLQLALRLGFRYALDRLRHSRGARLVLGNALVARLYKNLLDRGVPVQLNMKVESVQRNVGGGFDLVGTREGHPFHIAARKAVVMAGGGFPANTEWFRRYLPEPTPQYVVAHPGCLGETIAMAQTLGATLGPSGEDNALWFPSSVATRSDGSLAVYPHIVLDRGKPGLIAVNAAGRRFVNEAVSYHQFTRAMYREHGKTPCIPARLVCDSRFIKAYGLGMVRPKQYSVGGHVKRGYLQRAGNIGELAERIGVEPEGLTETVGAYNEQAREGVDRDFGKGESSYDRSGGDPNHRPNPCMAPLEHPPYYSVAVHPTPLGTTLGLQTTPDGQVVGQAGKPIAGLYACGNDMHSAFGGEYPGAGAQLGLGMTFGYLAARHAAKVGQSSK